MQNIYIFLRKVASFGNITYHCVLDILFPPVCVSCHAPIHDQQKFLCPVCFDKIVIHTTCTCPACGKRQATNDFLCHKTPYKLAAACHYHEPIPQLIHYFKYNGLEHIQTILSALLIVHLKFVLPDISSYIISYIPLHIHKERKRGFNQSRILATIVADYFNVTCVPTLKRIKNTDSQTKQHGAQGRMANIKDCFSCSQPELITGKNIILIDDVSTSGATLLEATKTLRVYHPRHIVGLVIAKVD